MKKSALFLVLAVFLLSLAFQASAALTTGGTAQPDVSGNAYQVTEAVYTPPTNTYDDPNPVTGKVPTYYFITQDPAKAGTTSITYQGKTFDVTGNVKVLPGFDPAGNTTSNPGLYSLRDGVYFSPDATYFFDDGNYRDDSGYTQFSANNLSIVGLNPGAVTFTRANAPVTFGAGVPQGVVERRQFTSPNIYVGNIIFDGAGRDMYPVGGSASTGVPRNRGEFAIHVGRGAANLVFENVTIQNVGATNTETATFFTQHLIKKNAALHIYASSDAAVEPKHFINLTVKDNKTTSVGTVFTNQSNNVFFHNLHLDSSAAGPQSYGMRLENAATANLPVDQNSGVFTEDQPGGTQLSSHFIQVQDYRYQPVSAPYTFRYVEYRANNPATPGSQGNNNLGTYRIWDQLPVMPARIGSFNYSSAILDREDNYWLVRHQEGSDVTRSITQQIQYIRDIRNHMQAIANPALATDIPPVNIKIVADNAGQISESFAVADFGAGVPVSIVAVPAVDALFDDGAFVPVKDGVTISLGTTANAGNVSLYQFDFDALAKLTLHETVKGVVPLAPNDPRDAGYPAAQTPPLQYAEYGLAKPAVVTREAGVEALPTQFVNCVFTELVEDLVRTGASINTQQDIALDLLVGQSKPLGVTAPQDPAFTFLPKSALAMGFVSTGPQDKSLYYESSDTAIATVDQATGEVTGLAAGTAYIYVKARDGDNQGELEKPYARFVVTVTAVKPLELTWPGSKLLNGKATGMSKDQFQFTVTLQGQAPIQTGNLADGSIPLVYPPITAAGTHVFTIKEVQGSAAGYTYDTSEYTLTVKVGLGDEGLELNDATLTKNGEAVLGAGMVFENTYDPPVIPPVVTYDTIKVPVTAKKVYKNGALKAGLFTFQLQDAGGKVLSQAQNGADGSVVFEARTFSRAVTNYLYKVVEVAGTDKRITYDTTVYTLRVTTTPQNGRLTAQVEILKNGVPYAGELVFTNVRKAPATGDSQMTLIFMLFTLSALSFCSYLLYKRRVGQDR